ncbi:NB-ARC domain-containing protein [Nocardiopsis dassonvillei]|uniref:NB-ARC domain-containing protein n=1 Tax=Nocardiopsis dassonvillei TaxID=2014 RepID=UPI003636F1A2
MTLPASAAEDLEISIPPAHLPTDITDFTGRTAVVREACDLLAHNGGRDLTHSTAQTLVITGMPGVGKTALAVHVAHRLRDRFEDGALYADLGGSTLAPQDPADVLEGFLRALGVPDQRIPARRQERSNLFRSLAARRRLLIVLDDVGSSDDARSLLPSGPSCVSIVTSLHRLYGLSALWRTDLDVLTPDEAVDMLGRSAGSSRTEKERSVAEDLVWMYGHLPLALRCVGARLARTPGLPLSTVFRELTHSDRPLEELQIGDLDVRSRYDAVVGRLNPLEQAAFRELALLSRRGFTVQEAADSLDWDTADVRKLIERLVDTHLLSIVPTADGRLHYTVPRVSSLYAREMCRRTRAGAVRC